jgi:hypothetical protein
MSAVIGFTNIARKRLALRQSHCLAALCATPAGARNGFAEPRDWQPKSTLSRPQLATETARPAFEPAETPANCGLFVRDRETSVSASPACAMLLPSGPANTRCSVCRFDPGGLHVQLWPAPGTGLQSPETGSQNRRYRDLSRRQRPHVRIWTRGNARKLRAIRRRPGNIGSHRTAWWRERDSNLESGSPYLFETPNKFSEFGSRDHLGADRSARRAAQN